ncbi:MAG: hypothetical protein ACP5HQ_06075 [Thermoprotei archaeon]
MTDRFRYSIFVISLISLLIVVTIIGTYYLLVLIFTNYTAYLVVVSAVLVWTAYSLYKKIKRGQVRDLRELFWPYVIYKWLRKRRVANKRSVNLNAV